MPFIVGLTGGIGSGKSTAAGIFAALGAAVVDTDDIAHALTGPGAPRDAGYPEGIWRRCTFGRILASTESRMREVVFADAEARQRLERILHPLILQEAERLTRCAVAPYVVLVVPLLLEKGSYRALVQRVLVLDCRPGRAGGSSGGAKRPDAREVVAIMATQLDRQSRRAEADDVIDNSGDESALRSQVERLHALYLRLAPRPKRSLKSWLHPSFSFIFARSMQTLDLPAPQTVARCGDQLRISVERAHSHAAAPRGSLSKSQLFRLRTRRTRTPRRPRVRVRDPGGREPCRPEIRSPAGAGAPASESGDAAQQSRDRRGRPRRACYRISTVRARACFRLRER